MARLLFKLLICRPVGVPRLNELNDADHDRSRYEDDRRELEACFKAFLASLTRSARALPCRSLLRCCCVSLSFSDLLKAELIRLPIPPPLSSRCSQPLARHHLEHISSQQPISYP